MGQWSGLQLQRHLVFRKARIYTDAESFNHRQDTRSQFKQARNQIHLNIKAYSATFSINIRPQLWEQPLTARPLLQYILYASNGRPHFIRGWRRYTRCVDKTLPHYPTLIRRHWKRREKKSLVTTRKAIPQNLSCAWQRGGSCGRIWHTPGAGESFTHTKQLPGYVREKKCLEIAARLLRKLFWRLYLQRLP